VKILTEWLEKMSMDVVDPVKQKFVPDHEGLGQCYELGLLLGDKIQEKLAE
jgi:hypothetical protein